MLYLLMPMRLCVNVMMNEFMSDLYVELFVHLEL